MIDGCGREIDHLRLSLTDRCNLACRYCAPEGTDRHAAIIDSAFAREIVRWLSDRHGIRHVRLTGGEPLLYPNLLPLVGQLSQLNGLHEVTLTTNGQALAQRAAHLRNAGLARVNVSLDTLDPQRFAELTGGGNITRTLAGIEAAVAAGLTPVRINVVAQRGVNDHELPDIAEWSLARGCVVRFLEVMPVGVLSHVADTHLVTADEILAQLRSRFEMVRIPGAIGQPARDYAVRHGEVRGVIGIIAPTTRPFCDSCRRLRITARGLVIACLHEEAGCDLGRCWDGSALDVAAADRMLQAVVAGKPAVGTPGGSLGMSMLGG